MSIAKTVPTVACGLAHRHGNRGTSLCCLAVGKILSKIPGIRRENNGVDRPNRRTAWWPTPERWTRNTLGTRSFLWTRRVVLVLPTGVRRGRWKWCQILASAVEPAGGAWMVPGDLLLRAQRGAIGLPQCIPLWRRVCLLTSFCVLFLLDGCLFLVCWNFPDDFILR